MGVLSEHPIFPILLSRDLDASMAFYRDTLGLEVARRDPDRIVFRCGGGTQLVVTESTVGTADTQTQVAWRVADIRAAIDELRGRGVTIEEYEAPDPVTTDGVADMGHSWAAWFIDPSAECALGGRAEGLTASQRESGLSERRAPGPAPRPAATARCSRARRSRPPAPGTRPYRAPSSPGSRRRAGCTSRTPTR